MCTTTTVKTLKTYPHPLDPLTGLELQAVVELLRSSESLSEKIRFGSIVLKEPSKAAVLEWTPESEPLEREAFCILLDNDENKTFEAVVSLTSPKIVSLEHIPGVQPAIMGDEFPECEAAIKKSELFRAAIAKRGITDMDLVMVDPWSAGYYGGEREERRLIRALCWIKASPTDNGYARPIEGVIPLLDMNKMEVIEVEDYGIVPLPPNDGNYTPEFIKDLRTDIKPIEITQPEGASFTVQGQQISWQKWKVRVGFTPREGLVLHQCSYTDDGVERPIFYRASLSEMTVPYADPLAQAYKKNAFDVGEYNLGTLTNSLKLGCDCLGEIYYFDATMIGSRGDVCAIENAVCLHEEDAGILWKHVDWRTEKAEVRRSRRLVVSFIATVGNYEYGYYWYFYQDGTIQYEVKLTGMLNTAAVPPGEMPRHGTLVAPGLKAPIHHHIFCVRLDMTVDGTDNSVYEVDLEQEEDDMNPYGNAAYVKSTLLASEESAKRIIDPFKARHWKIANSTKKNAMGYSTAFKLLPGENTLPTGKKTAAVMKRAEYMSKHLWVTPYKEDEMFPTGKYPNQGMGGDGIGKWTEADRNVTDTDVVVWYTFAHAHIPRAEDWPVMPVGYIGFLLKPTNFFDQNPSNDVPATPKNASRMCCSTRNAAV